MPLTNDSVYLVNPEGFLQGIPDGETFNNLFRNWERVMRFDIPTMVPLGIGLTKGAHLARGDATNTVFLISNGQKRGITSNSVMDKYNFSWERVYVIQQIYIDSMTTGPCWS